MDVDPRPLDYLSLDPASPQAVLPSQSGNTDEAPRFFVHFERQGTLMVLTTPTTHEHYFANCAAPS